MPEIHGRKRRTFEFDPLSHAHILPISGGSSTAREDFPRPGIEYHGRDVTHFS